MTFDTAFTILRRADASRDYKIQIEQWHFSHRNEGSHALTTISVLPGITNGEPVQLFDGITLAAAVDAVVTAIGFEHPKLEMSEHDILDVVAGVLTAQKGLN